MVALVGGVVAQLDIYKQFAKKEVGTRAGDYQLVVFSAPTKAGLHSPIAFEHGGRIAEGTPLDRAKFADIIEQMSKLLLHHMMVVGALGVTRDSGG